MAHWRLFYHFVWATKNREPLITPDIEQIMYGYLCGKAAYKEATVYAVGGYLEHLHVVASVHPKVAPSDFVHRIKGSTSHYINKLFRPNGRSLYFQGGYGVHSISGKQLQGTINYVRNQKRHHEENEVIPLFERWDSDNDPPTVAQHPPT